SKNEFDSCLDEQVQELVEFRAHRLRRAFFLARRPASRNSSANFAKRTNFSNRSPGVSFKFSRSNVRSTSRIYASTTGSLKAGLFIQPQDGRVGASCKLQRKSDQDKSTSRTRNTRSLLDFEADEEGRTE